MIAQIIWTILRYPIGTVVGLNDEFNIEYKTISGYLYEQGSFYVLFFEGRTINMKRLDELAVSIKKEGKRRCRQVKK